ncbi:TRAP transporter substrate-binding protein [Benzoatithermus flavus]|uniref:TRAP transporter substrate-binding protein n=1 Tax=Benzoatithermus flavus TaxID=3108223 RepID=A0ABU8XW03_9PROT
MPNRLQKALLSLALPAMLLLAGAGEAAEIGSHRIKFAAQNQKGHPQVMGMEKFAELVEQKSGGKISVKLFPGGTLGGDVQTISALQGGTIEMSVMNAGLLSGNVKEFAVVDLPFLFAKPEEADAIMDGPIGQRLAGMLPEKGLVGLAYWELGFRNLTNNRHPVTKAADIAGLKIRTLQSPIFIDTFNALGANAVPLPFPELYTALETGTVDGQENPFTLIETSKFYEVQKYATETRHVYNPQIVLVSKKFWDKLNADEQKLLQDAAVEARDYQRKVSREAAAKAVENLKAHGMQIDTLPEAEFEKIRETLAPVIAKHNQTIGEPLVQEVQAELKKLRAQN